MRIHTDILQTHQLYAALPSGVHLEHTHHGSRKRDHAYEVKLYADPGVDRRGVSRAFNSNTGNYGSVGGYTKAATWSEWGDWLAELYAADPTMIAGPYDGVDDFVVQTTAAAQYRPVREHAPVAACEWAVLTEEV